MYKTHPEVSTRVSHSCKLFLSSAPQSNILSIPLKIMMFLSAWKSNFGLMWTENLSRNLILKIEATQIMKLMILTGDHDNMIEPQCQCDFF